ncbi:MATE family efflux transporter [Treponema sp.]
MEYKNPLGEENITKLLLRFTVPATVGMLVNALYNIVDRIYIGNSPDLGSLGLAGITIGFPIMLLQLAIGVLFGIGGATLFSIKLGERKEHEAEQILGNAFSLLFISGFAFMLIGQLFLKPILVLFGASETVLPYSMEYMRVIFFGAVFQLISMGMNNFIRADGNPNIAMLTMFLGAGTNIILDPIFIYGFNMGMRGAALATIFSQFLSFLWVTSYFLGKKSHHKLKLQFMRLKTDVALRIFTLGLPGFFLQLASSLLNIVLNRSLFFYGGDIAVSGMGIINSLQMLILMPVIGIRQGAQPIISFNFGAGKYPRVKEAVTKAIIAGTAVILVAYLVIQIFPAGMLSLFNREPALLAFGTGALRSWFLLAFLIAFQIIASNYFQAIGKARVATFLTLTRQVIFLIPAIFIFPLLWGLEGILYAAPFADLCAALVTGFWFFRDLRKLKANALS